MYVYIYVYILNMYMYVFDIHRQTTDRNTTYIHNLIKQLLGVWYFSRYVTNHLVWCDFFLIRLSHRDFLPITNQYFSCLSYFLSDMFIKYVT